MQKPAYKIKIGSTTFEPSMNQEIISIGVDLDIDVPSDSFQITLKSGTKASAIKTGDAVTIELGYEGSLFKVLTGTVDTIKPTVPETIVNGLSTISILTGTRVNQVYEKQSAGAIVKDLSDKAGIAVKNAQDGLSFPMYVVDDTKDCYSHMKELARKCGFDLFMSGDGRLVFKKYKRQSPKPLKYGRDIIEVEVYEPIPIAACVKVYGESPSSLKGADTAHWISKKMVEGIAGSGSKIFLIEDPTVRDKDTADKVAASYLETIMTPLSGTLKVLGNARVGLGDTIEIKEIPDTRMNGEFEVTSISHSFNKDEGFVSVIGWVKKISISPAEPPLAAPPSITAPPKPSPLEEQLESAKGGLDDQRLKLQDTVETAEIELEKGLSEVNKAISEVDKVAKEMIEAAEEVKKTAKEAAKEALARADELKKELETAKKKVEEGLAEVEAKYEEFKKDAYQQMDKYEKEIQKLKDEAEKSVNEIKGEADKMRENAEEKVKKVEDDASGKLGDLNKEIEDKKKEIDDAKEELGKKSGHEKEEVEKRINELESSISKAEEKVESINKETQYLKKEADDALEEAKKKEEEAEKEIEDKKKEVEDKIKEVEDKKEEIKKSVEDAEKELKEKVEDAKKKVDESIKEVKTRVEEAKKTAETIEKEADEKFAEAKKKVEETKKEAIAKLEELKKMYSEVREKVMEARKQVGMD
jgi:hypothetical protein